jgi:hypothetical protein
MRGKGGKVKRVKGESGLLPFTRLTFNPLPLLFPIYYVNPLYFFNRAEVIPRAGKFSLYTWGAILI